MANPVTDDENPGLAEVSRSFDSLSFRSPPVPLVRVVVKGYKVGALIGETSNYRIRRCTLPDGRLGIFKIAKTIENNPDLDREAFLLGEMERVAAEYEAAYAKTGPPEGSLLNYELCFPKLVESFVVDDESGGGRRANVLIFVNSTDDISALVPAEQIISRDRVRVDPKTSVWIMGKLLKLLTFAHSMGIEIRSVTAENILIEREKHYVMIFDWTHAIQHDGGITETEARQEIADAAIVVLNLLEADFAEKLLLEDEQLTDDLYGDHLFELAGGSESDAKNAHEQFYALIDNLWPRGFHPYTSHSRKEE